MEIGMKTVIGVVATVVCALGCMGAVEIRPGAVDVVLPKKPLPIERFAADELTNFLSRVLGAPVPVVENGRAACAERPPYRAVRIFLGRAAGFDVSAFERDAFRTKVERSAEGAATICIAGRDDSSADIGAMLAGREPDGFPVL